MLEMVRETGSFNGIGSGIGLTRGLFVILPEELIRITRGGGSGRGVGRGLGLFGPSSSGDAQGHKCSCTIQRLRESVL